MTHRRSASDGGLLAPGGSAGRGGEAEDGGLAAKRPEWDSDSDHGSVASEVTWNGVLFKWTNYIHGWQPRYFSLAQGTLSYYKSEVDSCFGCRGQLKLEKAAVEPHDLDECRFQVSVMDSAWYLRAGSREERGAWVQHLRASKAESGYGSTNDLRRHPSTHSLASASSTAASSRRLREKLAELNTFRDIVLRQVGTLQRYFDQLAEGQGAEAAAGSEEDFRSLDGSASLHDDAPQPPLPSLADFKGEALTFRATTSGILATVEHCAELLQQREDQWRRRLEREVERRKRAEDAGRLGRSGPSAPDLQEGPHSALKEEEWHDALDAALDLEDAQLERLERRLASARLSSQASQAPADAPGITLTRSHPLFNEVERTTVEQVERALAGVEEGAWELFAEDGQMRMYKMEETRDGMIVDPLKATHSVEGVSAREYCHYFFGAEYKLDWDQTLDEMSLVERVSDDTLVIHQIHKKMWPAAQRESLFWTHMRRSNAGMDGDAMDCWVVANRDTEHPGAPLRPGNLRVGLTVSMVCQTILLRPGPLPDDLSTLTRADVGCRIAYQAQVNPGGWAPASALRVVYRREYPKFLKRFTQYVLDKTADGPLRL